MTDDTQGNSSYQFFTSLREANCQRVLSRTFGCLGLLRLLPPTIFQVWQPLIMVVRKAAEGAFAPQFNPNP